LSKYAYLKGRRNPKTVEVRDIKTNETTIYPSTYRVIKELGSV